MIVKSSSFGNTPRLSRVDRGMRLRLVTVLLLSLLTAVAFAWRPVEKRVRAAQLLQSLSAADAQSACARTLTTKSLLVESDGTPERAVLYTHARRAPTRALVLAHGVHHRGIDEPRLIRFAQSLACEGVAVLTPELSDLTRYRITARGVTTLRSAVDELSAMHLTETGRVGLVGMSFAGGLSLVAATDRNTAARLDYVTSVGGHHDLGRVLRFLVTDHAETPRGVVTADAHEYGLVILVLMHLNRFVPEEDLATMDAALTLWLKEEREAALAVASGRRSAASEALFSALEAGRLDRYRPQLEAIVRERTVELDALSPHGKLASIAAPVLLLHGAGDDVVPPSETEWADLELGGRDHRALVTPLLSHVSMSEDRSARNTFALIDVMAQML